MWYQKYSEHRFRIYYLHANAIQQMFNLNRDLNEYIEILEVEGLPEDAEVCTVQASWDPPGIEAIVFSKTFDLVEPGMNLPRASGIYGTKRRILFRRIDSDVLQSMGEQSAWCLEKP